MSPPTRSSLGQLKEVPSLRPTEDEFNDPIKYLSSPEVSSLGYQYGMVKIIPPSSYKPPLSINKNRFRFVPRLQKLKELNLLNRCRMFFHKQLSNYNKMQRLAPPEDTFTMIGGIKVYYYDFFIECIKFYSTTSGSTDKPLHCLAANVVVSDTNLWDHLSRKFELSIDDLKELYQSRLLHYFNFLSRKSEFTSTEDQENQMSLLKDESDVSDDGNDNDEDDDETDDPCQVCHRINDPDNTLLCDSCNRPFHRYCLSPPLSQIPADSWCCDDCVIGNGYYGFTDAPVEYSLKDFSNLSDDFDKHFFKNGKPTDISTMEKTFWSLVDNTDNDVKINYGADIHNSRKGEVSGFPTHDYTPYELNIDKKKYREYANHPMNLNNLPFDKNSLLNYLDVDISGMTIPWIYIGNTFSTFCWHVEDQYTLSANYQHFGATKKWYSIPSKSAEAFEQFMQDLAPDLFAKQPDILHQLITLVSPYKLSENGIECFTANQNPGEYIITYPRVYHAGFNCGYNFNEAVNFTMTEWLDYGILASKNYKNNKTKSSVFDIWELMISIVKLFLDEEKASFSQGCEEIKLVEKCLEFLKPRVEDEYGIQATIMNDLDTKPEKLSSDVLNHTHANLYGATEEEKKFAEDGITCTKCKGFCTFAFVKHFVPSPTKKNYLPTPNASPLTQDSDDDSKTRHSKRIKVLKESETYDTKILCLEDYLKLDDSDKSKDRIFLIREVDDVKVMIQEADKKLSSFA